jgi:hypothetical protein
LGWSDLDTYLEHFEDGILLWDFCPCKMWKLVFFGAKSVGVCLYTDNAKNIYTYPFYLFIETMPETQHLFSFSLTMKLNLECLGNGHMLGSWECIITRNLESQTFLHKQYTTWCSEFIWSDDVEVFTCLGWWSVVAKTGNRCPFNWKCILFSTQKREPKVYVQLFLQTFVHFQSLFLKRAICCYHHLL